MSASHKFFLSCRRAGRVWLVVTLAGLLTACHPQESWQLGNVQGELPNLQFTLTADSGETVTQAKYAGDVTLLYFGYTHCPDVCPETLAKLTLVLQRLGSQAKHVRVLFVSVDPARDTPKVLHRYVDAFDPHHDIGLSGSASATRTLAHSYHVGYQAQKPGPDGSYEVTHSSVIYIFDAHGHARLLASESDPTSAFVHDLRELVNESA